MQGSLPAPFGGIRVTLDPAARVQAVDLSATPLPEDENVPAPVRRGFEAYLDGLTPAPLVAVGEIDVTEFQARVFGALARVEPGEPTTYGELAQRIGKPGAARAVGQALRSNPLPLVWPCHRVTAADGLGGFGGAREEDETGKLAIKRWLLDHERRNDESRSSQSHREAETQRTGNAR